jgi:hypothetical protein
MLFNNRKVITNVAEALGFTSGTGTVVARTPLFEKQDGDIARATAEAEARRNRPPQPIPSESLSIRAQLCGEGR